MLDFTEIKPEGDLLGCTVVLHGRGVTGRDLVPLAKAVNLNRIRWVFPDGPLDFDGIPGGRSWYDLPPNNHKGVLESRKRLFELVEEIEKQGIPSSRVVLMGFSQGAVMSLDVGLRFPRRLAGIIGMSGYLAFPERLRDEKSPASAGVPILLTHGKQDDVLPVDGAREAQATLRMEGFSVRLHEYLMGHEVIPEALSEVENFLKSVLGEERHESKQGFQNADSRD